MSEAEFAEIESRFGARVVQKQGIYWRRVRPFFYQPLLAWQIPGPGPIVPPCNWFGGCQYVVTASEQANSAISFLIYDQVHEYTIAKLDHNRRRLIKQGLKSFVVKPIEDLQELKDRGYQAYLEFYHRTRYSYKSERTNKSEFEKWADTVFNYPKAILLGGYGPSGLTAVSVSYWVESTLVYATLFCETESLRKNVCEAMLHGVRQLAADQPRIQQLVARKYQGGNSIDQYYLIRGCTLVTKPARLILNPVAHAVIRALLPQQYARLCAG